VIYTLKWWVFLSDTYKKVKSFHHNYPGIQDQALSAILKLMKKGHLTEPFLRKKYITQYCAGEKLDETGTRLEHSPHKLLIQ
jgi:hypothetical protein